MAGIPSSSRLGSSPQPSRPHLNRVFDGPSGRILCIADIRGQHSLLNQLAKETGARAIIHTGDFGFFENSSLDRINERTLKHLLLYSPLVPVDQRDQIVPKDVTIEQLRQTIRASPTPLLSEFPSILSGKLKLSVPVYTVGGACEDVAILERFRQRHYEVENLYVIDEATSRTLEIGGIKLRLFGLGGAFVPHKLFDNGDGQGTIAGAQGTMWTTALQLGELVDTFQKTYDQTETRLLVTHATPGREGLFSQLALALKADLTISAGLHFRYASSWNEFSVQPDLEAYKKKLQTGKESFTNIWETVKTQVESAVDEQQKVLLEKALGIFEVPHLKKDKKEDDPAWQNTWNWNLCDAAFGHLVLDIKEGRVSAELKSQGFNYAYRRAPQSAVTAASTPASGLKQLPSSAPSPAPGASSNPPERGLARPMSSQNNLRSPNGAASPAPAINGVNGTTNLNVVGNGGASAVTSPKSPSAEVSGAEKHYKRKSLSNAERRERKAEKEKEKAGEAETGGSKPGSHPTSPAPPSVQGKPSHRKVSSKGTDSPAPSPSPAIGQAAGNESDGITSPAVGSDSSLAIRGPAGRPPRNPWTLYVSRLPTPVSEGELRDVFGEAKSSITLVKLTYNGQGPNRIQKPVAFVEFKDESSMRTALNNNAGKVKDQPIRILVAENREDPNITSDGGAASDRANGPPSNNHFRGGPPPRGGYRGRGGRGGGGLFAHGMRSIGQAGGGGMGMRKTSDGPNTNDP